MTVLLVLALDLNAQSEKKYVKLSSSKKERVSCVWLNTAVLAQNEVTLKAKIFTSFPLKSKNIKLIINGEPESSKAHFGSLYGSADYSFTYERTLNLPFRDNKFQIVISKDSTTFYSSIINIKEGKVSILDDGDFSNRILWTYPDPAKTEGRNFRSESRLFYFSTVIKSGVRITTKSSIQIILNKLISEPKPSDKLVKIGDNLYEYQGSVFLDPTRDNELFIRLKVNGENVDSKPYVISVDEDQPSVYLLSIGTLTNLEFTAKDARDFAALYARQRESKGIFQDVHIDVLSGIEATTNEIKGRIEELKIKKDQGLIKPKDLVILFISSHGFLHKGELRIQGDDYDPSRKRTTSISFKNDIMKILNEFKCKKLVFVDACHSGAGEKFNIADLNYEIEKLNQITSGITTLVSSQGDELSYEDKSWENGAFTEAILNGLQNAKADFNKNYIVTVDELYSYLKKEVPRMVMQTKGKPQNPNLLTNELGDVAIYYIN